MLLASAGLDLDENGLTRNPGSSSLERSDVLVCLKLPGSHSCFVLKTRGFYLLVYGSTHICYSLPSSWQSFSFNLYIIPFRDAFALYVASL